MKSESPDTSLKDDNASNVDKLLSSLDQIGRSTPAAEAKAVKPTVVMPIGSQRPKLSSHVQESKPTERDSHNVATISEIPFDQRGDSYGSSANWTPATVQAQNAKPQAIEGSTVSELELLKQELAAAKGRIAAMDRELAQQRITSDSLDAVLRSPSDTSFTFGDRADTASNLSPPEHNSDTLSNSSREAGGFTAFAGPAIPAWNEPNTKEFVQANATFNTQPGPPRNGWNALPPPWAPFDGRGRVSGQSHPFGPQPQRLGNLRLDTFENGQGYDMPPGIASAQGQDYRRNYGPYNRPGSSASFYNGGYSSYPGSSIASTPLGYSPPMTPMTMSMNVSYPQRPMTMALSPTASEFNVHPSASVTSLSNHWSTPVCFEHYFPLERYANSSQSMSYADNGPSSFVASSEPMNYRKMMDRNNTCDWKYIVDKIVCSNDQQASIFLQQKLKVASPEQKYEMIEAIVGDSYPLMINRFGNFLIQRCLEHGTPDQVVAIANSIRGNVLNLSMDAFGCHVVQKALDVVPEAIKASMVHELLHRIPETVIHRYACHVWQKLFEFRWVGNPPQIMKRVNEALRGMWHEVALGETGSLVVQNIFENCLEDDKVHTALAYDLQHTDLIHSAHALTRF